MNKKTQLIAAASMAVCTGWIGSALGGPGGGPYGPYGSSGAYGGFGPYTEQVMRGEPVHQTRAITYRERRLAPVGERTEYYRTQRIHRYRPTPVGERTEVTVVSQPVPESSGQLVLDTVTAPFRMVGNVFVLGGRAIGSIFRAPAAIAERTEPVAERMEPVAERTTTCTCPHERKVYRGTRTVKSTGVTESTQPTGGQVVARTVTAPFRMVGNAVVAGGRAVGTVVTAPARLATREPVAERTTVEKTTTVHHPSKRHVTTTKHIKKERALPPVSERTTIQRSRSYESPMRRTGTPLGTQGTEPVAERTYPNAEHDYANPYR
ncbi:MAG: hypothetical protein WCP06_06605 [Verrucomicrobiota bacterium]